MQLPIAFRWLTLCLLCPPCRPSLQVRKVIDEFKVGAPARVGLVAPNDVTIPAGNTGMDPSQTSFFQVGALYSALCVGRGNASVQGCRKHEGVLHGLLPLPCQGLLHGMSA